jgi:hypothetical protein
MHLQLNRDKLKSIYFRTEVKDVLTRVDRYELPPKLRDTITQRWGHVIRRYGYAQNSNT